MSLMNTVTKMAIGFAMAKGMDAVQDCGGIGSLLGGLTGGDGSGSTGLGVAWPARVVGVVVWKAC